MNDNDPDIKTVFDSAVSYAPEWSEPVALPEGLPSVNKFDLEMLPKALRPWCVDIAERHSVPLDFVAIPAMIALSSVIGAKVGVRPEAYTDWTEAANLWGGIVALPGSLKSPIVSHVLKPLRKLQAKAQKAFDAEASEYEDYMAVIKMAQEEGNKKARKAVQNGNLDEAKNILASVPESSPPAEKRFIVNNVTVEMLGVICQANPKGLLCHRDELVTLLEGLDKPDNGDDRDFFMGAWAGSGDYTFDRIGRGTIHVSNVNLAMLGTTQPVRISSYIRESLRTRDDGMVQRLQLLAWPDVEGDWKSADRMPDSAAFHDAFECFERLANLVAETVSAKRDDPKDEAELPYLRFNTEAVARFVEWRAGLERDIRSGDMPGELAQHLSKFRGLVPRLALIWWLASDGIGLIPAEAVEIAILWAEYLESHARRIYGCLSVDDAEIARKIWKKIEEGKLNDGFNDRDVYRPKWSGLKNPADVAKALSILVDFDWLKATTTPTGGRATTTYKVNPLALKTHHPLAVAA